MGDFVWYDLNRNGIQEAGEQGVAGVGVQLLDSAQNSLASTTTDGTGFYLFSNLSWTNYYVRFTPLAGYSFTPQNQGGNPAIDSDPDSTGLSGIITITQQNPSIRTVDAGMIVPLPGTRATVGVRSLVRDWPEAIREKIIAPAIQ